MTFGIRLDCAPEFWYRQHPGNPHWSSDQRDATPFSSFDEALTERSEKLAFYRTIVVPIQW